MIKKDEKNSIIEICPVRNVIARFGNKWAFLVILVLNTKLYAWAAICCNLVYTCGM